MGWIDYNQLSLFKGGPLWDRHYVIVSVLERRPSLKGQLKGVKKGRDLL